MMVSIGDNLYEGLLRRHLYEMSKPIFWTENKNISICRRLNLFRER